MSRTPQKIQTSSLFEKNVSLFGRFCPQYVPQVIDLPAGQSAVSEGTLNEAQETFRSLPSLDEIQALFLFGIGAGWGYDAAKAWLNMRSDRFLIFLEDDFAVLHRFFQTPHAFELLSDPQVIVLAFQNPIQRRAFLAKDFDLITRMFMHTPYQLTASRVYQEERRQLLEDLTVYLSMTINEKEQSLQEYEESYQTSCFSNIYRNLFSMSQAVSGADLIGHFRQIPAVICGAGPSIKPQIPLLKEIQNKALIFGAGTGMNVLTSNGIQPHFGVGVDPHPASKSRMMTNAAFEIPYFYQNLFHEGALECVHAPRLFLKGSFALGAQAWLEEQLVPSEIAAPIFCEISTTNLCLHIAKALGCNPIIFIGVDLAYTEQKRYPGKVEAHPLDDPLEKQLITRMPGENLVPTKNKEGKQIYTTLDWLKEATSYSKFAQNHSEIKLINCSTGLVIPYVPNQSLEETARTFFSQRLDLLNKIHAEIQMLPGLNSCTVEKTIQILEKWNRSFEQARLGEELHSLDVYKIYLKKFDYVYDILTLKDTHALKYHPELFSEEEKTLKEKQIEFGRKAFLNKIIDLHLALLKQCFSEKRTTSNELPSNLIPYPGGGTVKEKQQENLEGPSAFYSEEGQLLAKGHFFQGKREGENLQYYRSGKLYSRGQFLHGLLHGQQQYFYEEGNLKTIMDFVEGQLDGTVQLFYPNGNLKRELYFKEGERHGMERWWSEKGSLLLEAEYHHNQPTGIARSWDRNGRLRKEMKYHDLSGKCDLFLWDEEGRLLHQEVLMQEPLSENTKKALQETGGRLSKVKEKLKQLKGQKKHE